VSDGRRLIVTADDFGYDSAVNEAVVKAFRGGVLRYASLMVDRPGAREAARLAKENPGLGVGLHLELCADRPALWGARYFFSPSYKKRLRPEIERQLDTMLSWGLKPTHVDGHLNIHVHPVIFPMLCELADARGIPRVRLPGGELPSCWSYKRDRPAERLLNAAVFGALRAHLRAKAGRLAVPERTFGLLRSGTMSEDYLLWVIERLPPGETEVYFHPTARPGTEVTDTPTPTHHTATELQALLSPRVRAALEKARVSLASEPGPSAG
jgi:predicted glycoside hydrolase/deacetylase ChbG (UPF0249 family)